MEKRIVITTRKNKDMRPYNGMSRMEELDMRLDNLERFERMEKNMSDISANGIRSNYLTGKKELAAEIKHTVATLNKQISAARRKGLTIELNTNFACVSSDVPALLVDICEKITL